MGTGIAPRRANKKNNILIVFARLDRLNLWVCIRIIKRVYTCFTWAWNQYPFQARAVNTSFILKPIPRENFIFQHYCWLLHLVGLCPSRSTDTKKKQIKKRFFFFFFQSRGCVDVINVSLTQIQMQAPFWPERVPEFMAPSKHQADMNDSYLISQVNTNTERERLKREANLGRKIKD